MKTKMKMNKRRQFLNYLNNNFDGSFKQDELLAEHTYYKIGGPCDFFVCPASTQSLIELINMCRLLDYNYYILGEGANILVNDDGYDGIIINFMNNFKGISEIDNTVKVQSGSLLKNLVLFSECNELGGIEYLSGIPGTVGGALIMNAGTKIGEIGSRVKSVSVLDENLNVQNINCTDINFNYRSVPQLKNKIILGCELSLYNENKEKLKSFRENQIKQRESKQPLEFPNCGSVFKRPPNYFVGALVEQAGLKGFRYGDAMIPEKHGGFIVNLGKAKASEIYYVINYIKEVIINKFNVELETEVKLLGF